MATLHLINSRITVRHLSVLFLQAHVYCYLITFRRRRLKVNVTIIVLLLVYVEICLARSGSAPVVTL